MATDPRLKRGEAENCSNTGKNYNTVVPQTHTVRYETELDVISNLFELQCSDPNQEVWKFEFLVMNSEGLNIMKNIRPEISSIERIELVRRLFKEFILSSGIMFMANGQDFVTFDNNQTFYTLKRLDFSEGDEVRIPISTLTSRFFQSNFNYVVCRARLVQTIGSRADIDEYLKFLNVLVWQNFWDTWDSSIVVRDNATYFAKDDSPANSDIVYRLPGFKSDIIRVDDNQFYLRLTPLNHYFFAQETLLAIIAVISKCEEDEGKLYRWIDDNREIINKVFDGMKAMNFVSKESVIIQGISRKSAEDVMFDDVDTVYDYYIAEGVVVDKRLPVVEDKNGKLHPLDFLVLAPFQTYDERLSRVIPTKCDVRPNMILFDNVVEKKILFTKKVLSGIGYLTKYKFKISERLSMKAGLMIFPVIQSGTEIISLKRNELGFNIKQEISFVEKGYDSGFNWAIVNINGSLDDKKISILSTFLFTDKKKPIRPMIVSCDLTGEVTNHVDKIFRDAKNVGFIMYTDIRNKQLNDIMSYYEYLKGIPVLGVDPQHVVKNPEAQRKWKTPMKLLVNAKLGGSNFKLHYPKKEIHAESMMGHGEVFDTDVNRMFMGLECELLDTNIHVVSLTYTISQELKMKGGYSYEDLRMPSHLHNLLRNAIEEYKGSKAETVTGFPDEIVIVVNANLKNRILDVLKASNLAEFKFTVLSVTVNSNYMFLKYKPSAVARGTVFESLPQGCFVHLRNIQSGPTFFLRTLPLRANNEDETMVPWDEYTVIRSDVEVDLRILGYMMFHFCALDPTELKLIRIPFFMKAAKEFATQGVQNYNCAKNLDFSGVMIIKEDPFDQNLLPSKRSHNITHLLKPRLGNYFCCDVKK